MPWRYSLPPGRLTDLRLGFCAEHMRRRVGKSVVGAVRQTERRVSRLEAVTVYDNRRPRGLYLQTSDAQMIPIDFDADGRILVHSSDGTVIVEREPWERKSVLNLRVEPAEEVPEHEHCLERCLATGVAPSGFYGIVCVVDGDGNPVAPPNGKEWIVQISSGTCGGGG